ncbi:hypothetical protein BpHYR1_020918 [Brachionus plicatilis]|uniref:Uncharacterized protein n=1 Tax=Brachionus plicatilis TaxID=10195 RepID=A0A3M7QPW5_BRAPC|nr:hypothetical protein BpHYR1_020918 [Brachionus plicatilis]
MIKILDCQNLSAIRQNKTGSSTNQFGNIEFKLNNGIVKFKYKLNKNSSFFDELKSKCNKVSCTLLQRIFVQFVFEIHNTQKS